MLCGWPPRALGRPIKNDYYKAADQIEERWELRTALPARCFGVVCTVHITPHNVFKLRGHLAHTQHARHQYQA
jgi:hypothetical protein